MFERKHVAKYLDTYNYPPNPTPKHYILLVSCECWSSSPYISISHPKRDQC